MGESRRYRAYGLGIASELPLPALAPGAPGDARDVTVTRGSVEDPGPERWSRLSDGEALLRYDRVGRISVTGGDRIVVDLVDDPDPGTLNGVVCGAALAIALTQRGLHSLHAGAVEIGDVAIAFAGNSGEGKSTLTAALRARGHRLVSDDVVVVDDGGDVPLVLPGFPQVKLWPDAALAVGLDADALPRIEDGHDKRAHRLAEGLVDHPLRLARVYILDRGDAVCSTSLTGGEAVIALLGVSYAGLGRAGWAEAADFERTAALARAVDVRRLERPWSLDALSVVVDHVERDALAGAAA
jgi:hypothetical protein